MTGRELRILLLEDSPTDAALIEDALRAAGMALEARRVETREEFERALAEFSPDAILVDMKLPAFDGLSALRLARERLPEVPLVVVTGTLPDERAVEMLREGAGDYILKDRLSRLGPAVRRALDDARASVQKREAHEELRRQLDELRRFQKATVDRELRMKELKEENERLCAELSARTRALS